MSSKFDHLFFEFKPQYTNWGDWCHSPQAYFRGEADMPGANLTVGFQVFTAPVYLEREPHFHREEEYLVSSGTRFRTCSHRLTPRSSSSSGRPSTPWRRSP
jgi:hypothetical protein